MLQLAEKNTKLYLTLCEENILIQNVDVKWNYVWYIYCTWSQNDRCEVCQHWYNNESVNVASCCFLWDVCVYWRMNKMKAVTFYEILIASIVFFRVGRITVILQRVT